MAKLAAAASLSLGAFAANASSIYLIGWPNSNDCPKGSQEINSEEECRDAAASVGGSFQSVGSWDDYPRGCYGNPLDSKVWMNENAGAPHSVYAKVCRRDGDGEVSISMQSGGVERKATLIIPKGASGRIPLVVNSHAWGAWPSAQAMLSGFDKLADEEGFAIVYPRGYDLGQPIAAFQLPLPGGVGYSFNAGACCPHATTNKRQDVQFIRDLVAHVAQLLPMASGQAMEIDETRIYATGMSNGGFFTNRLACEARDLFAAVAPVSGILINGTSPTWGGDPFHCPQHEPPLPVLHFHGNLDVAVPWEGNPLFGFPSIAEYRATRLRLNGLADDDTGTVSYQNGAVTCTAHGPSEANFTFCKVKGGGHNWPGGGACGPLVPPPFQCSNDIDASRQIWEFFKRYSLKPAALEI